MFTTTHRRTGQKRGSSLIALAAVGAMALAACGSDSDPGAADDAVSPVDADAPDDDAVEAEAATETSSDEQVAITLITKDSTNAFFVAMQQGATDAAEENNVDLTIASGKQDGDEQTQITAIESAVAQGQAGILITPNGPGVNPAIEAARAAGLFVIALDTPPEPAETVDITFATDNLLAGELIGQWTAATLDGADANIALIDAFDDIVVATDWRRDQGFLKGMGIELADPEVMGDEEQSGSYNGGDYTIACQEAGQANEADSRTAMENCLNANDDINVAYAINEPAAFGVLEAISAAGKEGEILVVTIDGGCAALDSIASGDGIDATSQQYPVLMASLGMEAIATIARGGEPPEVTDGLDFFNTGVELVTNDPVDSVESIDAAAGSEICWG